VALVSVVVQPSPLGASPVKPYFQSAFANAVCAGQRLDPDAPISPKGARLGMSSVSVIALLLSLSAGELARNEGVLFADAL